MGGGNGCERGIGGVEKGVIPCGRTYGVCFGAVAMRYTVSTEAPVS